MPEYFTLTEFRDLPDMGDDARYPDDRVEAAASYIVQIIEREVGTSFIPREVTETLDGDNTSLVTLSAPYVLSVVSATADGVSVSDTLDLRDGIVRRRSSDSLVAWPRGYSNVAVTYQAGYSTTPPADVKEAAMRGTRAYLLETSEKSGVLDRRSSVTNDLGGTTTYVLAGQDQPTGYPQVDAVIIGWRDRIRVPRVA